jgi:hypothetical protein
VPARLQEVECSFDFRAHTTCRELSILEVLACLLTGQAMQITLIGLTEVPGNAIYARGKQQKVSVQALGQQS